MLTKGHTNDSSKFRQWGEAQQVEYITPWLTRVYTAGHGGYKVDRTHNGVIPK